MASSGELNLDASFTVTQSALGCMVAAIGSWVEETTLAAEEMSARIFCALLEKALRFVQSLGVVSNTDFRAEGTLRCPTKTEPCPNGVAYSFEATFFFPTQRAASAQPGGSA